MYKRTYNCEKVIYPTVIQCAVCEGSLSLPEQGHQGGGEEGGGPDPPGAQGEPVQVCRPDQDPCTHPHLQHEDLHPDLEPGE